MAHDPVVKGFHGPWEGTWVSEESGHEGPLRCLITAPTNRGHIYKARFQAKYRKLITLTYSYTVRLEVEDKGTVYKFHGEEDLGKLAGGVYQYDGQATTTNFISKYTCEMDHGTFRMSRPKRVN
jgi:hypothetical protein